MDEKKILIVDDDVRLQERLKEYLTGHGFSIISLTKGSRAIEKIQKERPDLIVLDIMMPDKDGIEVLKEIRTDFLTPIIMLTARGEDVDRIIGLELGADDYMPKPFNPRELLARIKAILRRTNQEKSAKNIKTSQDTIKAGTLILNKTNHILSKGDKKIELTTTEYKFMEIMMERPNIIFSRDRLMNLAQDRQLLAFDRSIDVHISRLRTKIEKITGDKNRIKTYRGSGYMFVNE